VEIDLIPTTLLAPFLCVHKGNVMREHDMGDWKFAHTIALIQHTKAAHCVEEMWAIAKMNSNWKVWMACLIKSKHAERQIIFRSRLLVLILVGLTHWFHVKESCQLQNYCSGIFYVREKRVFLSSYPTASTQTNSFLQSEDCCNPLSSTDAELPRRQRRETCQVASLYSTSGHSVWFLCLLSVQRCTSG